MKISVPGRRHRRATAPPAEFRTAHLRGERLVSLGEPVTLAAANRACELAEQLDDRDGITGNTYRVVAA